MAQVSNEKRAHGAYKMYNWVYSEYSYHLGYYNWLFRVYIGDCTAQLWGEYGQRL